MAKILYNFLLITLFLLLLITCSRSFNLFTFCEIISYLNDHTKLIYQSKAQKSKRFIYDDKSLALTWFKINRI